MSKKEEGPQKHQREWQKKVLLEKKQSKVYEKYQKEKKNMEGPTGQTVFPRHGQIDLGKW